VLLVFFLDFLDFFLFDLRRFGEAGSRESGSKVSDSVVMGVGYSMKSFRSFCGEMSYYCYKFDCSAERWGDS
jgi:hypothetical protein